MVKAILFLAHVLFIALGVLASPMGWKYLAYAVICLATENGSKTHTYCFNQLYGLDVLIASELFGTRFRTISGMVGQRSVDGEHLSWTKVERFIDWLAIKVGDKPRHCYRAYLWELNHLDIEPS